MTTKTTPIVGPAVYPWLVYNIPTGELVGSYLTPEQAEQVRESFERDTGDLHRVVRA